MREIVRAPDASTLADLAARRFLDRMRQAQEHGVRPQVALTGGSVARLVHRRLATLAPTEPLDWGNIDFWWGDERFLGPGHPDRNEVQARADLLESVGAAAVHPVQDSSAAACVEDAATSYAEQLRDLRSPGFDVVMLGMGPDGHIASLFPGLPQLDSDEIATSVTSSPKPPAERVTLTLRTINQASEVWFLVSGAEKAEAVRRAWSFGGSVQQTPARGISGPAVTWFVDTAAAPA